MSGLVSKELASAIFDSGVRVANIWCLAALSDCPPESIRNWCEEGGWPAELAWAEPLFDIDHYDDCEAWEEFVARCCDKGIRGFLVAAECPVYTATSSNSASCSWGHYRREAFYSASLTDALRAASEWGSGEFSAAIKRFSSGAA